MAANAVDESDCRGRFLSEDPPEDRIHVSQLTAEIESVREGFRVEEFGDAGIGGYAVAEAGFRFPRGHRVCLHGLVGVLARHSVFD